MCGPEPTVYPILQALVALLTGVRHVAVVESVTSLVWALLLAQSLHPADLARALPRLQTAYARQAMRRVRRLVGRAVLRSEQLTPHLVRAALQVAPDDLVVLVLDSTRCGSWELFTLGIQVGTHARVLPVAWQVVAYPWPKGQVTPQVVALLTRTLRCWPPERAVHLVADRGFPSGKLFETLAHWQQSLRLGYTIRLRAGDHVRLRDGTRQRVGERMTGAEGEWSLSPATYPRGRNRSPLAPDRPVNGTPAPAPSWLLVGRGPRVVPVHQTGPADQRRREQRTRARQAHLRRKGQPGAVATDHVWALLTTAFAPDRALASYQRRFATEPTYRDLKAWDLDTVVAREADPQVVDGLMGLAALAYLLQLTLGHAAGHTADPAAGARQQQWSTTDRLSLAWRGRHVLHDRAHDWRPWLEGTLAELYLLVARDAPARLRRARPPLLQEAA